ncbi:4'-phosphopantetheinyl transferase family protein [Adhaeretor mobilis]|uniref:4'-phosphopantetheinyl transferase sfp n=1 Tax=Adhaeretor mobilis TaxID=1930276 RepID=A0A517MZ99_9BACT|nr:4'-phosphopantetheinyl transferase superfamily protein [Adhaeretor mobilis]QDT00211.1 4'-phosphopantetheinyl transferase sfp [Adhaeretor mobilis]
MNLPVTIWKISLEQAPQVIETGYRLLSPDEQQRTDCYKVQKARESFILTRTALRQALAKRLDCLPEELHFDYSERGKPSLRVPRPSSEFSFSVSHSGELAVVAIADCKHIGIDCEKIRPLANAESLARTVLCEVEWNRWIELDEEKQMGSLLKSWTLKEACLKAIGTGLAVPMRDLEVRSESDIGLQLVTAQEILLTVAPWALAYFEQVSGYQIALAAAGVSKKIAAEFYEFHFDG